MGCRTLLKAYTHYRKCFACRRMLIEITGVGKMRGKICKLEEETGPFKKKEMSFLRLSAHDKKDWKRRRRRQEQKLRFSVRIDLTMINWICSRRYEDVAVIFACVGETERERRGRKGRKAKVCVHITKMSVDSFPAIISISMCAMLGMNEWCLHEAVLLLLCSWRKKHSLFSTTKHDQVSNNSEWMSEQSEAAETVSYSI